MFEKKLCDKCKVTLNSREDIFCEKCDTLNNLTRPSIYSSKTQLKYIKYIEYISFHSIDDKGITWFISARDNILKKVTEGVMLEREKEKKERMKIVKEIESWRGEKKYRLKNKEKIKIEHKQYRELHKNQISERRKLRYKESEDK